MNETEQLLLAQQDPQTREKLLTENDLFIRRCASKAAGRFVDCHDDAYSEALIAFNDAITAYRPDKGTFLSSGSLFSTSRRCHSESRHGSAAPGKAKCQVCPVQRAQYTG